MLRILILLFLFTGVPREAIRLPLGSYVISLNSIYRQHRRSLRNYSKQRLLVIADRTSIRYHLPKVWLRAVLKHEANYKPIGIFASSWSKHPLRLATKFHTTSFGVTQMTRTAFRYADKHCHFWYRHSDIWRPELAIDAAACYLSILDRRFHGDAARIFMVYTGTYAGMHAYIKLLKM